jgi:hypothetical protein
MLPIHIAIKKHVEPSVINALVKSFPGCVEFKCDVLGMTPLEMASVTSSIHQDYYLRVLTKGSDTHIAITTDPLSDLLCWIDYNSLLGKGPSLILSR